MRESDLKISVSGIRGIVGQSLTPQLLIKFSEAFSSYIGGVFNMLIEALRKLAFFRTIIEAVEDFEGLDQFFVTVYDNLGWILPAIIAAYIIVQIVKTVGFLWRKRPAPK